MSSFTKELIATPLDDGKTWVIREEFQYDVGAKGSGDSVIVPVGFVTDFASIPKIFWSLLPNWGPYGKAAIIHDYLYFSHNRSKKEADNIFYEGMLVLNVPKWKASLIYQCVHLFGEGSYKKPGGRMIKTKDSYIQIPELEI